MTPSDKPRRVITAKELRKTVPYSPSQIRRLEKQGRFPKRFNIGPHRVVWDQQEIKDWLDERASTRDE